MNGSPASRHWAPVNRPFVDGVEIVTVMVGDQRQDRAVNVWNH